MAGSNKKFHAYIALIFLSCLIVLFAAAGTWQLNRAKQRDTIAKEISLASKLPPINLNAGSDPKLQPWHNATAHGHWLHQFTVLLENRNYKGQPGYWVATPFSLNSATTIVVLRGWLPRTNVVNTDASGKTVFNQALINRLSEPKNETPINGQLIPRIPRALELWSWPKQNQTLLNALHSKNSENLITVQNLNTTELAQATGLNLLPMILEQTQVNLLTNADNTEVFDELIRDWPLQSRGADTNRGYALQWFSFCVIACAAWLILARRTLKKKF